MQTLGYVGAVKAWLHAPLFAVFGINVWTVRLPSILLAAATLVLLLARSCGASWAARGRSLLLALLATDPVFAQPRAARLGTADDRGVHARAVADRAVAMAPDGTQAFWLATLCVASAARFFDKLNFLWVIVALVGAAALVSPGALRSSGCATGARGSR